MAKIITDHNVYGEEVLWRPIGSAPASGPSFVCTTMYRGKPFIMWEVTVQDGRFIVVDHGYEVHPSHWTEMRHDVPHERRTEVVRVAS